MESDLERQNYNEGLAEFGQIVPRNFERPDFRELPSKIWPHQWQPTPEYPTPQSLPKDEEGQIITTGPSFRAPLMAYRVGEPHMPVGVYREAYDDYVDRHPGLVVSAETGSGKSSNLGLYSLERGAPRVFVTQTRVLASRELDSRAQVNLGPHKDLAGYLTGMAVDSRCGPDARLIYVTDQLLFKMANRGALRPDDTFIVDEAHEQAPGSVFALGLLQELQQDFPDQRIIISSATINTEKFSNYLKDPCTGEPAPILILPGRTFPVKREETTEEVAHMMRENMKWGKNVLAFEPGVTRMRATWAKVQSRRSDDVVHMLYGDQSPAAQKAALNPADRHHVIATRIGETSITPEGKDVVVDSGLSNVGGYDKGVRSLRTIFSSKATIDQRAGRVGRTKEGEHYLAQPDDAPPAPSYDERPDHDIPPIQSSSVTAYILELLSQGRRIENMNLLDRPTEENLQHDYLVLERLGAIAMVGDTYELTDVGQAMLDIPLDVSMARMLVEVRNLPEGTDDADRSAMLLQAAAIGAIQQVRGIIAGSIRQSTRKGSPSEERSSDVLYELDVFTELFMKQQGLVGENPETAEMSFDQLLASNDVLPNRYYKARRIFEELCLREELTPEYLEKPTTLQRDLLVYCQLSGAEEIFVRHGKYYHDIRGERRGLTRRSVISSVAAEMLIGTAFDIEGLRKNGRYLKQFISGASTVSLDQVLSQLPHRVSQKSAGYVISRRGTFVERTAYYFDDELLLGEVEEAPSPTHATRLALLTAMMTGEGRNPQNTLDTVPYRPGTPNAAEAVRQWRYAQKLEHQSKTSLNAAKRYESLIKKVVRESVDIIPLEVVDPAQLDALIPRVYLNSLVRPTRRKDVPKIIKESPDGISVHIGDDKKEYVPVIYKHNIAYVTVSRDQMATINREDFTRLLEHHEVKLRIGTARYQQFEDAFDHIEAIRESKAAKRVRREQRDLEAAAMVAAGPRDYSRPPLTEADKEAKAKATNAAAVPAQQRRHAARMLIRGSGENND
jgi:hypothetical protein